MKSEDLSKKTKEELIDLLAFAEINLDIKNCELARIPVQAKADTYSKTKEITTVTQNIGNIKKAIDSMK